MFDGKWVILTAEFVVLTDWPPAPLEWYTSIFKSSGNISIFISLSISGVTVTDANGNSTETFYFSGASYYLQVDVDYTGKAPYVLINDEDDDTWERFGNEDIEFWSMIRQEWDENSLNTWICIIFSMREGRSYE